MKKVRLDVSKKKYIGKYITYSMLLFKTRLVIKYMYQF